MERGEPRAEILRHMGMHIGPVEPDCLTEIVPTLGMTIHLIRPGASGDHITLFTSGMSDRPMAVPPGDDSPSYAELMIALPPDWPTSRESLADEVHFWPFKWLRQIAAYIHESETWLRAPCTVFSGDDPPKPLASNTRLSCLMLLLNGSNPPPLRCDDGRVVGFYQLYPLYTEERDLEAEAGLGALLTRFEKHDISDVVDVERINVAF